MMMAGYKMAGNKSFDNSNLAKLAAKGYAPVFKRGPQKAQGGLNQTGPKAARGMGRGTKAFATDKPGNSMGINHKPNHLHRGWHS